MTTLAPATKRTLHLAAWSALTITSSGTGTVVRLNNMPGGGDPSSPIDLALGDTRLIGPFATPTTHRIECVTGSISWEVAAVDFPTAEEAKQVTVTTETGTTYTYDLEDAGCYVRHNNAGAITATVPPNVDVAFPIGTQINVEQKGAGLLTLAAGAGVTINTAATLAMSGQFAVASLIKVATNEWTLAGSLAAA